MTESRPAVVLIGDMSDAEMQPVVSLVQGWNDRTTLRHVPTIAEFRRLATEGETLPDIVVTLQTWPTQFSEEEVRDLLSLVPLARIVCVTGRWCDSEGRTGKRWPLAVRTPVACAPARLAYELESLRGNSTFIPLTASRAEIFTADCARLPDRTTRQRELVIVSPDRRWKRMLAAALCRGGHHLITGEGSDIAGFLWDADPWCDARAEELRTLRRRHPQSTIVACAGFLGNDIISELSCAGADAAWFKLAPLADLLAKLDTEGLATH